MKRKVIYSKFDDLSSELKSEVNDFIDFLLNKNKSNEVQASPQFGCAKGLIILSDDFDEPIEDFKEYM